MEHDSDFGGLRFGPLHQYFVCNWKVAGWKCEAEFTVNCIAERFS